MSCSGWGGGLGRRPCLSRAFFHSVSVVGSVPPKLEKYIAGTLVYRFACFVYRCGVLWSIACELPLFRRPYACCSLRLTDYPQAKARFDKVKTANRVLDVKEEGEMRKRQVRPL